jgi:hypothetical protein
MTRERLISRITADQWEERLWGAGEDTDWRVGEVEMLRQRENWALTKGKKLKTHRRNRALDNVIE